MTWNWLHINMTNQLPAQSPNDLLTPLAKTTKHAALDMPRIALTMNWACWKPRTAMGPWAMPARSSGPMKDRGTAPEKVRWS